VFLVNDRIRLFSEESLQVSDSRMDAHLILNERQQQVGSMRLLLWGQHFELRCQDVFIRCSFVGDLQAAPD